MSDQTPEWEHLVKAAHDSIKFIHSMDESGQGSAEFVDGEYSIHLPLQIGIQDGVVYMVASLFASGEDSRSGQYFAKMIREGQ